MLIISDRAVVLGSLLPAACWTHSGSACHLHTKDIYTKHPGARSRTCLWPWTFGLETLSLRSSVLLLARPTRLCPAGPARVVRRVVRPARLPLRGPRVLQVGPGPRAAESACSVVARGTSTWLFRSCLSVPLLPSYLSRCLITNYHPLSQAQATPDRCII